MFGLRNRVLGGTKTTAETSGAWDGTPGIATGLVSGTRVATRMGWRPVEALAVGDEVLTFDHGLQTVIELRRDIVWSAQTACPAHLWPLLIPAGALGNLRQTYLLPEQQVLVESDAAEDYLGDPFAMLPAGALEGFRGITRQRPTDMIEVVSLHFRRDEVVFANIGALFFQPKSSCLVGDLADTVAQDYVALSMSAARELVEMMIIDDQPVYPAEVDEALLEVAVA
ncbi:MAG: Hint domain-containing protein [Pseudomonadota bacterium]